MKQFKFVIRFVVTVILFFMVILMCSFSVTNNAISEETKCKGGVCTAWSSPTVGTSTLAVARTSTAPSSLFLLVCVRCTQYNFILTPTLGEHYEPECNAVATAEMSFDQEKLLSKYTKKCNLYRFIERDCRQGQSCL